MKPRCGKHIPSSKRLKFASLINLRDDDKDIDSMITTYNTAVTDAASEILGKECRRKSPG